MRDERDFAPLNQMVLRADRAALRLARALTETTPLVAVAAAVYKKEQLWLRQGFARLEDHCREVFGRSGRWLRNLAALGSAHEREPVLAAALTGADGGAPLGRCRATLVARVASRTTVKEWVALARGCSVVELKRRIREAREAGELGAVPLASPSSCRTCSTDEGASSATVVSLSPCRTCSSDTGKSSIPLVSDGEPDTEPRCRLALSVPVPVAAAFEEGLELYRAVEGSDATVTSFIEALSAEQVATGAAPPESVSRSSIQGGESQELQEERMAARSRLWSFLPRMGEEESALRRSASALERFESIRRMASGGGVDSVRRIAALVELEDELEQRLGELLLAMSEAGAWSRLGFTGAAHYAEERLGVSRSWAEDRLRAARALRRHPKLREAYESSFMGLEALLKVSRLLDQSKEPEKIIEAWIRQASRCTVKRLRDEARELLRRRAGADGGGDDAGAVPADGGAAPTGTAGAGPTGTWSVVGEGAGAALAGPDPSAAPTLDAPALAAPTLAGAALGGPLSDDEWFHSLRRRAGMARHRIERLSALARTRGVAETTLALRLPESVADMFLASLAASCRTCSTDRSAAWPDEGAAPANGVAVPPDGGSALSRARAVPPWEGLLAMLVDFARTWDHDELDPDRPPGADEALVAFGWRCGAPGCTSRRNLHVHHIIYRSHGGNDAPDNLVVLCAFHHLKGEHGGLAWCRGSAPLGLLWRLGEKSVGQWYRNERRVQPAGWDC